MTQNAVAKVAARIEIEEVRLRYVTAVVGAPSPADLPDGWADEVVTRHEAHAVLGDQQGPLPGDLSNFLVTVTFRVEYWTPERTPSEDELPDVGLSAAYDLTYALDEAEGLRHEDLQEFARVNAVFNAWPYWRELVDSTTRRMGFTKPLIVGVLTAAALVDTD